MSNPPSRSYQSFLVRIWQEEPGTWHKQVEHVQAGQSYELKTLEELLELIQQTIDSQDRLAPEERRV